MGIENRFKTREKVRKYKKNMTAEEKRFIHITSGVIFVLIPLSVVGIIVLFKTLGG